MTDRRYLTKTEHARLKAQLTRAKNGDDPVKVLDAVENALDAWAGAVWPDSWSTWRIALDDAYYSFARTVDYFERPYVARRFREAFDRFV